MNEKSGSRTRERIVVTLVALVVLGAILAGAYYREDLTTYLQLQGWDSGSAEKVVRDFVPLAHRGDPAAEKYLDGDRAKAVIRNGKLTAVSHHADRGPADVPIANLVPAAEVKNTESRIRYLVRAFGISVEYPNGKWAEFAVRRTPAGLKIVDVSDMLLDRKHPPRD